jgi:hypothetical protein
MEADLTLSNGVTLSPRANLGALFGQARLAFDERRVVDMSVIAALLEHVNLDRTPKTVQRWGVNRRKGRSLIRRGA